jgi:hypothetical protein
VTSKKIFLINVFSSNVGGDHELISRHAEELLLMIDWRRLNNRWMFLRRVFTCGSQRGKDRQLVKNEQRPKIRLKNGSEVDARGAYVIWRMLELEEPQSPQLQLLLAMARGNESTVSTVPNTEFKTHHRVWFLKDGALHPVAKQVLLSAYRDTPDGPVIVSPFQLNSQQDIELLAVIQRQHDRSLRRFFRDMGDDSPGQSR